MTQKKNAPAIQSDSQSAVAAPILLSQQQQANSAAAWQLKSTHGPSWAFPSRAASWHNCGKPRGPVLQNTNPAEVAAPTVKRGFVTPKFWGVVRLHCSHVVTGGMGISVRTAARLLACFEHPVHLMRFKTQKLAFFGSPAGIQTMTVITLASRPAALTPSITGTSDPIQLHADAHNALSMALHYLSQPKANVPGARRKAVQALAALRGLDLSLEG